MRKFEVFNKLTSFLFSQRQSGTTSLLKKIAQENDVWVITKTREQAKEFGDKGISIGDLLMGLESKPILIDNDALMYLSSLSADEISRLSTKIAQRDDLIKDIQRKINNFVDYRLDN